MRDHRYNLAVAEINHRIGNVPVSTDMDGVEWLEHNGRRFPKEWLVAHCAVLVVDGVETDTVLKPSGNRWRKHCEKTKAVTAKVLEELK